MDETSPIMEKSKPQSHSSHALVSISFSFLIACIVLLILCNGVLVFLLFYYVITSSSWSFLYSGCLSAFFLITICSYAHRRYSGHEIRDNFLDLLIIGRLIKECEGILFYIGFFIFILPFLPCVFLSNIGINKWIRGLIDAEDRECLIEIEKRTENQFPSPSRYLAAKLTIDTEGKIIGLTLDLIGEIPKAIVNLKNLRKLKMTNYSHHSVPSWISELEKLEELAIIDSKLTEVPSEIYNLVNLKRLTLDGGKISSISEKLKKLINLNYLHLTNMHLEMIPHSIGFLENLIDVSFVDNRIKKIPKSFQSLINIKILNLTGNPLKKFPQEILKLRYLEKLYLDATEIYEIPMELTQLKHLRFIAFDFLRVIKKPEGLIPGGQIPWNLKL